MPQGLIIVLWVRIISDERNPIDDEPNFLEGVAVATIVAGVSQGESAVGSDIHNSRLKLRSIGSGKLMWLTIVTVQFLEIALVHRVKLLLSAIEVAVLLNLLA